MKPIILSSNYTDACSFYRGCGPLGRLRNQGKIDLIISAQIDWTLLSQVDAVFMLRPESPWQLQLARMCSNWNIPLWVDIDDDLFSVPEDNPGWRHYSSTGTQNLIKECLSIASFVTASTPTLAKALEEHANNVNVIPNALDGRFKRTPSNQKRKVILWRGSKTHERDLEEYSDAIVKAAKDNPGWHWHFQGCNPWRLVDRLRELGNTTWGEPLPVEEYMGFLTLLSPTILVVPLADHVFNRSKSNIAWIEATYAGAATLAPNWDEWEKPGVTTYTGPESFTFQLNKMMNLEKLSEKVAVSERFIEENLMLDHVNNSRLQIITEKQ